MRTLDGLAGLRSLPRGVVLSIGNFDGVHRGHASIVALCKAAAGNRPVTIATFEPHPLTVLNPPAAPPRLTRAAAKAELFGQLGVDFLVNLPPTPDVLNLSAEAFWALLRDEVGVSHLVEGETFVFGKGRGGTIGRLREWTAAAGVALTVAPPVEAVLSDCAIAPVSSSLLRWLIGFGRARDAATCLGRPYAMCGQVVRGFERGRTIGVPTANLALSDDQLVPADGVYAGRCAIDGKAYAAAISIGTLPTFGGHRRQAEAHLLGFAGDLYDRTISLEVIDWIRDQRKFSGIDALKRQISRDLDEIGLRLRQAASYFSVAAMRW